MHSLFVCIQIAHRRALIAAFLVIRYDATLQKFLFCVFVELVISNMPFRSECFVTQLQYDHLELLKSKLLYLNSDTSLEGSQ